jgi:hypothetical protein
MLCSWTFAERSVASPAGARAERSLSERHRAAWPRTLYAYDVDEARRVTGDKILLESPAGRLAIAAEYKAVDEGTIDLNSLQAQLVADSVGEDVPAFVIQFTHPHLDPPQPWTFRLWPVNEAARSFGPVELTERGYVQFLYVLQRGPAGAGGGFERLPDGGAYTWIEAWAELDHLDDRWPADDLWPDVTDARPRSFDRRVPPAHMLVAQQYVKQHGRFLRNGALAEVRPLIPDRPALGAIRRAKNRAPAELEPTRATADRFERLSTMLAFKYRKMWQDEAAGAESREMYTGNGGWRGGRAWWQSGP